MTTKSIRKPLPIKHIRNPGHMYDNSVVAPIGVAKYNEESSGAVLNPCRATIYEAMKLCDAPVSNKTLNEEEGVRNVPSKRGWPGAIAKTRPSLGCAAPRPLPRPLPGAAPPRPLPRPAAGWGGAGARAGIGAKAGTGAGAATAGAAALPGTVTAACP